MKLSPIAQLSLLGCGILSSLLYIAMNIFIPSQWEDYNSASQTVSELSAIGAPTRGVWVPLAFIYTFLFIAFGIGVLSMATMNRRLRITGILIVFYGIVSIAWPFAPMHLRGEVMTLTDKVHIILATITVVSMLLMMGFGAATFSKTFKVFTIVSMITQLIFGVLTFLDAPRMTKNIDTPWIGVWERINIGVFLIWIVVLATILIRKKTEELKATIQKKNDPRPTSSGIIIHR